MFPKSGLKAGLTGHYSNPSPIAISHRQNGSFGAATDGGNNPVLRVSKCGMAYTVPSPADLKVMYPAFAQVADATVQAYLDRVSGASGSGGDVDQSWLEGDYGPAIMAAAAHRMVRAGVVVTGGDVTSMAAAGLTDFQSGSFRARFSDEAVKAAVAGGWPSTSYGQDYLDLLRKNKGGPRVTPAGAVPCCDGFNGYAGPLPPHVIC